MTDQLPDKFFVSGTDTGIGKTVVSAMLMSALDATYWKPIQSGLEEETDTEFVKRVAEVADDRIIPERYRLNEPMSPHSSADIDGVKIGLDDFELPDHSTKHLIVEGAGGLWVPVNWKESIMDLIIHLNLPVLLVSRSTLGTLNHTLLSLEALRNRGIEVIGVLMNGPEHKENKRTIEHFGNVKVWELFETLPVTKENLIKAFKELN